jgi:hypothetical protein
VAELQLLLSEYEKTNSADILLPPAPEEVSIPNIDETEVGCAKHWQNQMMLQTSSGYDNQELQQLASELLRLCVERGVELNAV